MIIRSIDQVCPYLGNTYQMWATFPCSEDREISMTRVLPKETQSRGVTDVKIQKERSILLPNQAVKLRGHETVARA